MIWNSLRLLGWQTVYVVLDKGQSEMSNLIGQLQVHYFIYELPWSNYKTWDSCGAI